MFNNICLDRGVLELAIRARCDIRTDLPYCTTLHKVTGKLPTDSTLCGSMENFAEEIAEFYLPLLWLWYNKVIQPPMVGIWGIVSHNGY